MDLFTTPSPERWQAWKKSSFSAQGQSERVEVAPWGEVRDSQCPGVTITVPTTGWRHFISVLKAGDLNH